MTPLWLIILLTAVCMTASYLFGSINFAIIITRIFIHKDIRDFGSGNAGATNVLRTVGKTAAALTVIGDVSKGVLSVLLARMVFGVILNMPEFILPEYLCGVCALLGHLFPIFYKFKGGKGVLVSTGAMLTISPIAIGCSLIIFIIVAAITRYVSLSSIIACGMFPIEHLIYRIITHNTGQIILEMIFSLIIVGYIVFMHRTNIQRLINGTEHKLGEKKES